MEWGTVVVSVLGVVAQGATALVAIRSIRRSAEEQRISAIHAQMVEFLPGTVVLVRRLALLLEAVANRAVYQDRVTGRRETAYDRFVTEHPALAEQVNLRRVEDELYLPKELYQAFRLLVERVNDCVRLAYRCRPDKSGVYPESVPEELAKKVDALRQQYDGAIEAVRAYIGTDALRPLGPRLSDLLEDGPQATSEQ